jgi:hypothetical protein
MLLFYRYYITDFLNLNNLFLCKYTKNYNNNINNKCNILAILDTNKNFKISH